MTKVYIVLNREYDPDSRVEGVFSTREKADRMLEAYLLAGDPDMEIEEWELDPPAPPEGTQAFSLTFNQTGKPPFNIRSAPYLGERGVSFWKNGITREMMLTVMVFAKDEQEATQLAHQKYQEIIASGIEWEEEEK